MKQKIFILTGFLSILLLWTGCPSNVDSSDFGNSGGGGGGGNP